MDKAYHFTSSPEKIAVEVEKELLFYEREQEINWTKKELEIAESDKKIFLEYGEKVLNRLKDWDIFGLFKP